MIKYPSNLISIPFGTKLIQSNASLSFNPSPLPPNQRTKEVQRENLFHTIKTHPRPIPRQP